MTLFFFWLYMQTYLLVLGYKGIHKHYWKQQKLTEDFHTNRMSFLTHSLSKVLATSTVWELDLLTFVWHTEYWKFMTLTSKLLVFLYNKCMMMPWGKKIRLTRRKIWYKCLSDLKICKELISFNTYARIFSLVLSFIFFFFFAFSSQCKSVFWNYTKQGKIMSTKH